jgi:hypothetical protein
VAGTAYPVLPPAVNDLLLQGLELLVLEEDIGDGRGRDAGDRADKDGPDGDTASSEFVFGPVLLPPTVNDLLLQGLELLVLEEDIGDGRGRDECDGDRAADGDRPEELVTDAVTSFEFVFDPIF